jgi:hypothetical protein
MTNGLGRPLERTPPAPLRGARSRVRNGETALESLQVEARYRRERLGLYKARMYAGRARDPSKLRDLERSSDGAAKRLRVAQERSGLGHSRPSRSPAEMQRDD